MANRTHGMSEGRYYHNWWNMHSRCYRRSNKDYKHYGGRGITVCKRWHSFENFYSDMGPKPEGRSLDRIDNSKGYSKKNCRWSTQKEQCRNRRSNVFLKFNGKRLCLEDWGIETGIYWKTIHARINALGWTIKSALTTPARPCDRKTISFRGESLTKTGWARKIGITRTAISERFRRGWTVEQTLTLKADSTQRVHATNK